MGQPVPTTLTVAWSQEAMQGRWLSILQESGRPHALTTLTAQLLPLLQLLLVISTQLDTLQVCQQPPVPTTLTAISNQLITGYGYTQSHQRTQTFIIVDHVT